VQDDTGAGRTDIWKAGIQLLLTHPWGVGIHGYSTVEGLSHEGLGKWSTAHNSFLQIGVELGVIGLVLFVRLLIGTIRDLRILRRTHARQMGAQAGYSTESDVTRHNPILLAVPLEISLWGFMVGGFFLSQAYSPLLYVILALSVACSRLCQLVQLQSSGRKEGAPAHTRDGLNLANRPQGIS
jgi:O-antigen ligase